MKYAIIALALLFSSSLPATADCCCQNGRCTVVKKKVVKCPCGCPCAKGGKCDCKVCKCANCPGKAKKVVRYRVRYRCFGGCCSR